MCSSPHTHLAFELFATQTCLKESRLAERILIGNLTCERYFSMNGFTTLQLFFAMLRFSVVAAKLIYELLITRWDATFL